MHKPENILVQDIMTALRGSKNGREFLTMMKDPPDIADFPERIGETVNYDLPELGELSNG